MGGVGGIESTKSMAEVGGGRWTCVRCRGDRVYTVYGGGGRRCGVSER